MKELLEDLDRTYPHKIRSHRKFGVTTFLSRRNWGHDGISADGMIVIGKFLNVSYKYEPEYVQAHEVNVGYYLGNGRWVSYSFSWPRR